MITATDRASTDAMLTAMAQMMGLKDVDAARRSPSTLVGDAEQRRDEIRRRVEELEVSYFFCRFLEPGTLDRFIDEVIAKPDRPPQRPRIGVHGRSEF